MKTVFTLLLCAVALGASSEENDEHVSPPIHMQMSPEQAQGCKDEGGCIVITKRALVNLVRQSCRPNFTI